MDSTDIDQLLTPISAESPSGPDLSGELFSISNQAQPQPDPADPEATREPDWPTVVDNAAEILTRCKHLQAAVILTQGLVHTEGFRGLNHGLALLHGFLEAYWDSLYPLPDEDGDTIERVNLLQPIADADIDGRDMSDAREMLHHHVRRLPLLDHSGIGRFTLRDVLIKANQWPYGGNIDDSHPPPDFAAVTAELRNNRQTPLLERLDATLQEMAVVLEQALGRAQALHTTCNDQFTDYPPTFQRLAHVLQRSLEAVQGWRAEGGFETPTSIDTATEAVTSGGDEVPLPATVAAPNSTPAPVPPGAIRSRDDVIDTLDKLCEYYRQHEPSSPVPLLLQRAKRLVPMEFFDILQDLAPTGMDEARQVTGVKASADDTASEDY